VKLNPTYPRPNLTRLLDHKEFLNFLIWALDGANLVCILLYKQRWSCALIGKDAGQSPCNAFGSPRASHNAKKLLWNRTADKINFMNQKIANLGECESKFSEGERRKGLA
jgi:hypothetical protein